MSFLESGFGMQNGHLLGIKDTRLPTRTAWHRGQRRREELGLRSMPGSSLLYAECYAVRLSY
jgi:hypothetical protein